MEEAKAKGAMALFGEKYGDSVRVIQLGDSVELCGGTHVSTTAALSPFVIVSESSVAAGIRRIEALAGHSAAIYLKQAQQSQQAILEVTKGQDPLEAMESMKKELSAMQKALKSYQSAQAGDLKTELLQSAKAIGPYNMMAAAVDLDAASAKDLAFALVKQDPKSVVLLALSNDGKAQAHMAVGKQALDVAHAGQWVKALGHYIQGSGGGQDFYASAGGKSPSGIPDLLQAFEEKLTSCINA
jgi:alanyl-tRNA synthetase